MCTKESKRGDQIFLTQFMWITASWSQKPGSAGEKLLLSRIEISGAQMSRCWQNTQEMH